MALAGLRELAPGEPEIARTLLAATRDADLGVRRAAVTALAALDEPPAAVLERLIARVVASDPDAASRRLAVVALGEIGRAPPPRSPPKRSTCCAATRAIRTIRSCAGCPPGRSPASPPRVRSSSALRGVRWARMTTRRQAGGTPTERSRPRAWVHYVLWPLALVVATLAAYLQVRDHEFLSYDDPGYVIANPNLRLDVGWEGVRRAFTEPFPAWDWVPLTSLSLQVDYQLYGLDPTGYLLTNVALHALSTLVLYAALTRMTGARGRSAFVAAVFALHPLHVESVAWVTERKDVLSGLFFMLALYAYAGFAKRPRPARLLLVTLCLLAGLLSKSSLVTLPFVLLLLDWWPLGRLPGPAPSAPAGRVSLRRAVLEKIPMFLLVTAVATIIFVVGREAGAMSTLEALPIGARVRNALESYVIYAAKSFWPSRLAVLYPLRVGASPVWLSIAAALLLAAVSILVARHARARPYLAVGWLWYLGMLVPTIGLVQAGVQARADRFMYLPLIGLSILVAWGAHDLLDRRRALRYAGPAAGAVLAALWICTSLQVGHWRSSIALFEHALAVTSENYLAHEQLADAQLRAGDTGAAEHHYRQALSIRPSWATARFGLADVQARRGDLAGAIANYESELRNHPNYPKVAGRYGFALLRAGRFAEACTQLELAVAEEPGSAGGHAALAVAYGQLGRTREAIDSNRESLRLDPGQVEPANNLAWLLATRAESTVQEREESIRLAERATGSGSTEKPALLDTLAAAYATGGRFEEAAATATRAAVLADARGETEMARGIRERGELYRTRQAYVESIGDLPR